MHACNCNRKETYFTRMKFHDGQIHFREVCRICGGNARKWPGNVGLRELRNRGIDPDSLPLLAGRTAVSQHFSATKVRSGAKESASPKRGMLLAGFSMWNFA